MARSPRKRNLFGVYHISQHALAGQLLFRDDRDREYFVTALQHALEQYPSDLLAYCLIEPASYHLIVRFRGANISQFMASLNIRFAHGVERNGPLFRDRYQSRLLTSEEDLEKVLERLSQRGRGASEWNNACSLDRLRGRTAALGMASLEPLFGQEKPTVCYETAAEVVDWLQEALALEGLSLQNLLADKPLRNKWLRRSRQVSSLTLRELGHVFGGLSESMVSKIMKQGVQRA